MSIIVKNYTWKQSKEKVFIQVPLNSVPSRKVDVFVSEKYLKLHYSPFLFETFLFDKIDENVSQVIFVNNEAFIQLVKKEEKHWDSLEVSHDKTDKIKLRNMAIEEVQIKKRKELDDKIQRKEDLHKHAMKEAMETEAKERKNIKDAQENERNKVVVAFESRRKDQETKIKKEPVVQKQLAINKPIVPNIVPPLRKSGTIYVKFSERIFPTPTRESTSNTEGIWLQKVHEARKASGFVPEDLRPEECNPQWCKEKGDQFFKQRNYKGALNAYTHGIKLSEKLPSLYSNRAVAHYAMGNFIKCIEDCSSAIDLCEPICLGNLNMRVKCIVRRAAALTRIGMLNRAINEMKCAIKLKPEDESLKSDLYNMERAWEQNPDSD